MSLLQKKKKKIKKVFFFCKSFDYITFSTWFRFYVINAFTVHILHISFLVSYSIHINIIVFLSHWIKKAHKNRLEILWHLHFDVDDCSELLFQVLSIRLFFLFFDEIRLFFAQWKRKHCFYYINNYCMYITYEQCTMRISKLTPTFVYCVLSSILSLSIICRLLNAL